MTFKVTGHGHVPTNGVDAVALEVTAFGAAAPGFMAAYRAGTARPASLSTVRFSQPQPATNMAMVKVSATGRIAVFSSAAAYLRVDVVGWLDAFTFLNYDPSKAAQFSPVATPTRVVNSVSGVGVAPGKLADGRTLTLNVAGTAGIPASGLRSVALTITALNENAGGSINVYPANVAEPTATALTYTTGHPATNTITAKVSAGQVKIRNHGGPTDLFVDVVGYYALPGNNIVTGQGSLVPLAPILDTTMAPGTTATVSVESVGLLPDVGIGAVVVSLTATGASGPGSVTAYAADAALPGVRSASYEADRSSSSLILVAVSGDGRIKIRNTGATATLTAHVAGWYPYVIPPPPFLGTRGAPASAGVPPAGVPTTSTDLPISIRPSVSRHAAPVVSHGLRRFRRQVRQMISGKLQVGPLRIGKAIRSRFDPPNPPAYPFWSNAYLPSDQYLSPVGRLYSQIGSDPQTGSWCSATVVSRDVIVTAAHCILNESGDRFDHFWFAPAQQGGVDQAPYGQWFGSKSTYYTDFFDGGHQNLGPHDYGFVKLDANGSGQLIGDVTTYYGLLANSPSVEIYSLGYPTVGYFDTANNGFCSRDPSNDTCYAWYCHSYGSIWPETPSGSGLYDVGFGCNQNKGISGGPIFEPYNGTWYVASVNSHFDLGNAVYMSDGVTPWYAKNMWGPYFNQATLDLLAYIEAN